MTRIQNAVNDCMDDLELNDIATSGICEIEKETVFHVTIQLKNNENSKVVFRVHYEYDMYSSLLDDHGWGDEAEITIFERHGFPPTLAEMIRETLSICVDPDYYDSDDSDDSEDTLSILSSLG